MAAEEGLIGSEQVDGGSVFVGEDEGERLAVAELTLVPDQVDVVEVLGDRFCGPATASGTPDQLEAGVDPGYVVLQIAGSSPVTHPRQTTRGPRRTSRALAARRSRSKVGTTTRPAAREGQPGMWPKLPFWKSS